MFSKKNLKRDDFIFEDGWFQNKIKKPKQMHMQQFQISDCEECNIYIFDSSACVYIDSCKYCNIYIGPSESSVFIRDCQYLTVIAISQQFRVRDTFGSRFAIFCQSQPIIQSSSELTFSCYPCQISYKQLQLQSKQAKLNLWNNNWFDLYDFTPDKFYTTNFKRLDFQSWRDKNTILDHFQQTLKSNSLNRQSCVIPKCKGKFKNNGFAWQPTQVTILILFPLPQAKLFYNKPVLHFRYQNIPSQLQKIFDNIQHLKNQKMLFAKIGKGDEQKFKQFKKIKIVNKGEEVELIQTLIFTPFKDEH